LPDERGSLIIGMSDNCGDTSDINVLIVEDDADILQLMKRFFEGRGYKVSAALLKSDILALLKERDIDIVLLDLMLPHESGQAICQSLRQNSNVAVIMVTASNELCDRIAGLELGADDYIGKPFELEELDARIRAILRRSTRSQRSGMLPSTPEFRFGDWTFVPSRRALYSSEGIRVTLTGSETDLMLAFCQNAGALLGRRRIIELLYGDAEAVEERTIDLIVSRLRRKLADGRGQLNLLRTVRGDGYIFSFDGASSERVK